jgi:hypothetical protein
MERMSGESTPETETPSKPILTLLTPEASDDDRTPPTYRCAGGSCSIG